MIIRVQYEMCFDYMNDIVFTGHEKIAQLLIHNGADFTIKNNEGKTASEIATEKGRK